MKSFIFLGVIFVVFGVEIFAQSNDEYYQPPSQRKDVRTNAYPNLDRKVTSLYFGLEGGFKQSFFSQNGTLDNLVSGGKINGVFWGMELGYNMDDRWAVETGYFKNPSYFTQAIRSNRGVPFTNNLGTNLHTIPFRFKYKILTIDAVTKTASVYISAGVLLATNAKDKRLLLQNYVGVTGSNRDSVKLKSETFLQKKGLTQFELAIELQGRVTNSFSLGLFGRTNFGANGIVRSDLTYSLNGNKIDEAQQFLKGFSYNFGLLARYDLARGYKYKSKTE